MNFQTFIFFRIKIAGGDVTKSAIFQNFVARIVFFFAPSDVELMSGEACRVSCRYRLGFRSYSGKTEADGKRLPPGGYGGHWIPPRPLGYSAERAPLAGADSAPSPCLKAAAHCTFGRDIARSPRGVRAVSARRPRGTSAIFRAENRRCKRHSGMAATSWILPVTML